MERTLFKKIFLPKCWKRTINNQELHFYENKEKVRKTSFIGFPPWHDGFLSKIIYGIMGFHL